jgi:hypothetical protein
MTATTILLVQTIAPSAMAQDVHPSMNSTYWANVGAFFAYRDFDISIEGAANDAARRVDFESALGFDDRPDLLMAEFGWRFADRWELALQHFQSERNARYELQESIELDGVAYDVGADISAASRITITRLFFARRFWGDGPHDVRLGAGVHWLEAGASVSGIATLDDMSTEFRTSAASASLPIPNLGAWYRYSPSQKWLLSTRADWLSASLGKYSGSIWNIAADAKYSLNENFGIGLAYQHFSLDGRIKDSGWRGEIGTKYSGFRLYFSAFW